MFVLFMFNQKSWKLEVKLDNSGFWRFLTQKLKNFETRFWTRDTCLDVKALEEYLVIGTGIFQLAHKT